MSDKLETHCYWAGWDDLDYASIFDPMIFETQFPDTERQWNLDYWIHNVLETSNIGVGLIRTVTPPGVWKWFCDENPFNFPNSKFDIPFAKPEAKDEVLLFRRNRFIIKKPGEIISRKHRSIEWITWIDTEEMIPNGFFFYKLSDSDWWEEFWPDEMMTFHELKRPMEG